ncbi:MAG: hypothetical protein P1V97_13300 [Planctomycetota bacterium]|nr:hypothetical protein [Planctomycetota bacterium]
MVKIGSPFLGPKPLDTGSSGNSSPILSAFGNFQSSFHKVLFAWEWLIPVFILMTFGSQIERKIGGQRFAFGLAIMTIFTAVVGLLLIKVVPELGETVAGPIALGLGLLSFHLFLFPRARFFGAVPNPLAFVILSSLMITIVVIEVLAYRSAVPIERSQLALLPGVICGGSVLYFDDFFKETRQRLRDKKEVALVIEEVDSRAQVEQLLTKISVTGMGSLTAAEKKFLQNASRFYRSDSSRQREA